MKDLLLCRHAEAAAGIDDRARTLTAAGVQAARRLGRTLRDRGLLPDLVLSSTARRALQTAELACEALRPAPPLRCLPELYLAPPARILAVLARSAGDAQRVMVVGHNPGLHLLARALAREGPAALLDRLQREFPTGATAWLVLACDDWRRVAAADGRLVDLILPEAGGEPAPCPG